MDQDEDEEGQEGAQGRIPSDAEYSELCQLAQDGKTEDLMVFMSKLTLVGRRTLSAEPATPRRNSPLTLAARFGREATVRYFLGSFPEAVEVNPGLKAFSRDPDSAVGGELRHDLPLYWASLEGHLEIAKALVSAGASVNLPNCMQATPLHAAAASGHLKVVEYLVSKGADVNASDHLGTTPLMAAVGNGHIKVVQYLLKRRADVNCRNVDGYTALHIAAWRGYADILKKLPHSDVSLIEADSDSSDQPHAPSPLFLAASSGHERIVAELLSQYPECPDSVRSDAYMLLGVGRLKMGGLHIVENYWQKALAMKVPDQTTCPSLRLSVYWHKSEISSSEELSRLFSPSIAQGELLYQGFLILERCLGYGSRIIIDSWNGLYRINIPHHYCSDAFDHKLMEMATYSWKQDVERGVYRHPSDLQLVIESYLLRFSRRSYKLISASSYPALGYALKALEILQLVRTRYKCEVDSLQSILSSLLYITAVWLHNDYHATKSSAPTSVGAYVGPEKLEGWGAELVGEHLCSVEDKTLLHIALSDHRLAQEMGYSPFLYHDNSEALSMTPLIHALVRWGADAAIDLADWNGQRPLHLAAQWANKTSGKIDVITPLVHCGAHLDYVNREGKVAFAECTDANVREKFRSLLCPAGPLKLSCLACHAIVKAKVPYKRLNIPPPLLRLIECHDTNIQSAVQ